MSSVNSLAAAIIEVLDVPISASGDEDRLLLERRASYLIGALRNLAEDDDWPVDLTVATVHGIQEFLPVTYEPFADEVTA